VSYQFLHGEGLSGIVVQGLFYEQCSFKRCMVDPYYLAMRNFRYKYCQDTRNESRFVSSIQLLNGL